ncbi:MAG: YrhK family protein [Acidimicrobiales bacterium]
MNQRDHCAADWLFLVGSLLFALKPTIDLVRSAQLRKLPGHIEGPSRRHTTVER